MKATELMVGDWVIPHIWDADSTPSKIVGIHYNSYRGEDCVDWVDCEVWEELDMNDIKPIPLTAEILEKNGFDRNLLWHHCDKDLDKYSMSMQLGYADKIEYIRIAEKGKDDVIPSEKTKLYLTHIRYVHEFQHALRLCGVNDLADNLKI